MVQPAGRNRRTRRGEGGRCPVLKRMRGIHRSVRLALLPGIRTDHSAFGLETPGQAGGGKLVGGDVRDASGPGRDADHCSVRVTAASGSVELTTLDAATAARPSAAASPGSGCRRSMTVDESVIPVVRGRPVEGTRCACFAPVASGVSVATFAVCPRRRHPRRARPPEGKVVRTRLAIARCALPMGSHGRARDGGGIARRTARTGRLGGGAHGRGLGDPTHVPESRHRPGR